MRIGPNFGDTAARSVAVATTISGSSSAVCAVPLFDELAAFHKAVG